MTVPAFPPTADPREVNPLQNLRERAGAALEAGDFAAAERDYLAILAHSPRDPTANHGMGMVLRGRGDLEGARRRLETAVMASPGDPAPMLNYAGVLFELGRLEQARSCYEAILDRHSDWPPALRSLGATHLRLGHAQAAAGCLVRVTALTPGDGVARYLLGLAAEALGEVEGAKAAFVQALDCADPPAEAAFRLGEIALTGFEYGAAEGSYRRALELAPGHVAAMVGLARSLIPQGQAEAAIPLLERALGTGAAPAIAAVALSQALRRLGRLDDAEACCAGWLAKLPGDPEALVEWGFVHQDRGRLEAARDCYAAALAVAPEHMNASFCAATLDLLEGDLERGFAGYERRLQHPIYRQRHSVGQRWLGETLPGATLLIEAEQGFGDTLQFARFVPLIAARVGRTILRVPPELLSLMRSQGVADQIIANVDPVPGFDRRIELMSLPHLLGIGLASVPPPALPPTLDAARVMAWRERLGGRASGPRVGLVWAGNPGQLNEYNRSMPAEALAPLASVPGIQAVSLQTGAAAAAFDRLAARFRAGAALEIGSEFEDFSDTAAALSALDLLISVDTAIVHLAGTLGIPTWLLLSATPDWRWLLERSDSPWYPSVTIFRQTVLGDWSGPVARIAHKLCEPEWRR